MTRKINFIALLSFLTSIGFLNNVSATHNEIIDLFSQQSLLEMTIVSDFPYKSFHNMKNPDTLTKSPGILSLKIEGRKYSRNVGLQARGSGRLNHCQFAPFKLFFEKNGANDIFSDLADKDLKVVTHCDGGNPQDTAEKADVVLLKEFLMYKILKSMNVPTLEVRMAKIRYLNTHGKEVAYRYAFLVEPTKNFLNRNRNLQSEAKTGDLVRPYLDPLQNGKVTFDQFEKIQSMKVDTNDYVVNSIGQFMIQNGDWAGVLDSPNTRLFLQRNGLLKRVHYDFDLSLIVGKWGAKSNRKGHVFPSSFNLDSSWLLSFCKSQGMNLEQVADEKNYIDPVKKHEACKIELKSILSTQADVFQTIDSFDLLDLSQKQEILDRVRSFFHSVETVLPSL
jgi:hypothetical protein